jgi:hypothetical protein
VLVPSRGSRAYAVWAAENTLRVAAGNNRNLVRVAVSMHMHSQRDAHTLADLVDYGRAQSFEPCRCFSWLESHHGRCQRGLCLHPDDVLGLARLEFLLECLRSLLRSH